MAIDCQHFNDFLSIRSLNEHPVSLLHEYSMKLQMICKHEVIREEGPANTRIYHVRMSIINGDVVEVQANGSGAGKALAKINAARKIIAILRGDESQDVNDLASRHDDNRNYVVELAEFCAKRHLTKPKYCQHGVRKKFTNSYEMICIVDEFYEMGEGISKGMAKNEAAKMVLATLNELNITLPAKKAATKPVDETSGMSISLIKKAFSDNLDFHEHGISTMKNVISQQLISKMNATITTYVRAYAMSCGCSIADYLQHVSLWQQPSTMADSLYNWVALSLHAMACTYLSEDATLYNISVVNASYPYSAHTIIPGYQNMDSAQDNSHEVTIVVPLVTNDSAFGNLEFLPNSQMYATVANGPTEYWKYVLQLQVNAGDAIIFDSSMWYRSIDDPLRQIQFCLVTLWRLADSQHYSDDSE